MYIIYEKRQHKINPNDSQQLLNNYWHIYIYQYDPTCVFCGTVIYFSIMEPPIISIDQEVSFTWEFSCALKLSMLSWLLNLVREFQYFTTCDVNRYIYSQVDEGFVSMKHCENKNIYDPNASKSERNNYENERRYLCLTIIFYRIR